MKCSPRFLLFISFFFWMLQKTEAQNFSNKGRDFWVAYTGHIDNTKSRMALYISSRVDTKGKVEANGVVQTFTVKANTITTVQLTSTSAPISNNIVINNQLEGIGVNKGIHITADNNVVVYAHILNSARSGSTLVLPTTVLGREYIASSYQSVSSPNNTTLRNTEFAVIAVQNNTTVEITPTAADATNIHPAKTTYTIVLNKGDVYQYQSKDDITGTKIRSIATGTSSCQQIAVFSGSTWTAMGCSNANTGDNLYQQLFPMNAWGKTFLTAPSINRSWDIYRILVKDSSTIVKVNGVALSQANLINNAYYEFNTQGNNTYREIVADGPICVLQYFISMGCDNSNVSDPEMIILSPIEQTINDVVVMSARNDLTPPLTNISEHYLNIIYKTIDSSSLKIDGAKPKAKPVVMGSTGYSFIQEDLTASTIINPFHRIVSDSGFACIAYGYGNVESYGYNAGTNMKDLYQTLTVDNPLGNVKLPATCIGTPFDANMTLPYIPLSIRWIIPTYTDTIVDNNPRAIDSSIINNKTIYKFKLNQQLVIDSAGNFVVQVIVNNPLADGCSGEQTIDFEFQVYGKPTIGYDIIANNCVSRNQIFKDTAIVDSEQRPTIKWNWDFGTGNFTETNSDSILHVYNTAGIYTTRYFAITDIGCVSDTLSKQLIIDKLPNINFTTLTPNCEKKYISFQNQSQHDGATTIQNSIWRFGDTKINDSLIGIQNTQHIYDTMGSYQVILQSTTLNGCTDSLVKTISVKPLPVAKLVLPLICLRDSVANFINQSSIVGNEALRFNWNFGDLANTLYPNTDTVKNPSHKYINVGNYDIQLISTSASGCVDTSKIVFTVNGAVPKVDFNFINDTSLCSNKMVQLHNNTTIDFGDHFMVKIFWDLNQNNPLMDTTTDAYASTNTNYSYSYQNKISYPNHFDFTVKLVAYSGTACADSLTKNIQIVPPPSATPQVTSSKAFVCQFDSVQLFATVQNGAPPYGYHWTTNNSNAQIWDQFLKGLMPDSVYFNLELVDQKKCTYQYDSIESITIRPLPTAALIARDSIVCNQSPIVLKANSNLPIQSYQWYLNKIIDTITLQDSIFIHQAGSYSVITNDGFCNSLYADSVLIQAIDIPIFTISHQPFICINTGLPLQTNTREMKYVHYVWDFGDSTTQNLAQPTPHAYQNTGSYIISLQVSNDFCPDTNMNYTLKTDTVKVVLPITASEFTFYVLKYTDTLLQPKTDASYTNYLWKPGLYLNNNQIQNPLFHAVTNMDYALYRTDTVTGCKVIDAYHIISSEEVAVNIPKAFTPNKDNLNDELKPAFGAGIKQFNHFSIYNRWGKLVFTTNDINKGWDGLYQNEPQLMDMYSYLLDYITYKDEHIKKTGSFLLIR